MTTEMTKQDIKRIVTRNALIGAAIILTPTIVMVILDVFDKHTPNNICMFSTFVMAPMLIFQSLQLGKSLSPSADQAVQS